MTPTSRRRIISSLSDNVVCSLSVLDKDVLAMSEVTKSLQGSLSVIDGNETTHAGMAPGVTVFHDQNRHSFSLVVPSGKAIVHHDLWHCVLVEE